MDKSSSVHSVKSDADLWVLHALSLLVLYDVEVAALPVDGLLGRVLGVFGFVPPLRP